MRKAILLTIYLLSLLSLMLLSQSTLQAESNDFLSALNLSNSTCFARVESSGVVFNTIQEAVDTTTSGDVVKVAGYCSGNVLIDSDNDNLTLSGGYTHTNWTQRDIQANKTVIDGGGGGTRGFQLYYVSDVTLSGFWITNASRGITVYPASNIVIEQNYIHDMVNGTSGTDASYTVGININSYADYETRNIMIRNNIIWNITDGWGHGINVTRGQPYTVYDVHIFNNTIYNVSDDGFQAGQPQNTLPLSGATIYNNVIANVWNSAIEIFDNSAGIQVDYNCTDNSSSQHISGPNDVFGNPLFLDAVNADFHLQDGSPCIDAGTNTGIATDIEGVTRPQGLAYDMGAYEKEYNFDCTAVTQILQAECEALVALDDANPNNTLPANWFSNPTPCSWWAITCDSAMATINELDLQFEGLTNLPPQIGNLTNLESLGLLANQLTDLPSEFGNLTHLEWLTLTDNQLTDLPPEFGNLTNLTGLLLDNNQLTSLPPEFGNLSNLESLYLNDNQLGDLPSEITNLTPTGTLSLKNNPLCITDQTVEIWIENYDPDAFFIASCQPLAYLPMMSASP